MSSPARLITHHRLTLPDLPGELDGFRIAHLTDLHIARRRPRHRQIVAALDAMRLDLIVMTGDYARGDAGHPAVVEVLREIARSLRPRLGFFGVFGNHDVPDLRRRLDTLDIHWLKDQAYTVPGLPLVLLGADISDAYRTDSVLLADRFGELLVDSTPTGDAPRAVRLMLAHMPTYLITAGDMGVDFLFCGHTHGGQIRLPGRRPLTNSTDLPLSMTSGLLRHRDTLCAASRGLGEVRVSWRLFCPPQLPVYTLRPGPMPGEYCDDVRSIERW